MVTSEEYNDLAIVILNWNGKNYLEKFLPSVIKHSKNARIIVADNASTDTSISFLREHYPFVEIIQNESNGGFAKGYNLALKKIDANYYLLLNSDIEVTENWLSPLIESVKDESVAGCQPKVLAFNQKTNLNTQELRVVLSIKIIFRFVGEGFWHLLKKINSNTMNPLRFFGQQELVYLSKLKSSIK